MERCTAVVFIHKYETGFKTLGPVLFVAAVSEVFRKFESLNSASFFNLLLLRNKVSEFFDPLTLHQQRGISQIAWHILKGLLF